MTEQLQEIATRLAALRIFARLPVLISLKRWAFLRRSTAHEAGEKIFPSVFFTTLQNILGVDVLDILSGESPKLSTCTVVRKGEAIRSSAEVHTSTAIWPFTFRNKMAEPFMVTVEPKGDDVPTLHDHKGQEFNYIWFRGP